MRTLAAVLFVGGLLAVASFTAAQPPGGQKEKGKGGDKEKGGKGGPGGPGGGKAVSVDDMVTKMMTYDKNKDGKLSKDEVADDRLKPLFERADADKDGTVTKAELTALLTKEAAAMGAGGMGGVGGGPGGPGGFPGGPGGPGGMGGGFRPPAPGQIMPVFLQDELKLTDAQKKELDAIQKEVDAKLDKLLTAEQRKAFQALKERGPGGPGGFPGGNPPTPPKQ